MKIRVDPEKCQGHARCYGLAPEIFDVDDYGQASVIMDDVPPELQEKARLAVANCPEYAIEIIADCPADPSRDASSGAAPSPGTAGTAHIDDASTSPSSS